MLSRPQASSLSPLAPARHHTVGHTYGQASRSASRTSGGGAAAAQVPLVLYSNVRTNLSGKTARVRTFRSAFFTRMFERKVDVPIAFAIGERSMPRRCR